MARDEPFQHPRFPIYLVTRLAAWDLADVKAMIDRGLAARNRGKFVIDLGPDKTTATPGCATRPCCCHRSRVVMDETATSAL